MQIPRLLSDPSVNQFAPSPGSVPPSSPAAPLPAAPSAGTFQYKIGDMVGRGAFGKVFQAMNLENGELMAVKCIELENVQKEELEEIKNEVRHLSFCTVQTGDWQPPSCQVCSFVHSRNFGQSAIWCGTISALDLVLRIRR